jgi:hypothetical protein
MHTKTTSLPSGREPSYVLELGLVKDKPLRIANPIYTEVVARVLSAGAQHQVMVDPRSLVRADGRFDMSVLLREFAAFWVEHGEFLTTTASYREAAPQLVLMEVLQRVVNGGGIVTREYGIGRRRILSPRELAVDRRPGKKADPTRGARTQGVARGAKRPAFGRPQANRCISHGTRP